MFMGLRPWEGEGRGTGGGCLWGLDRERAKVTCGGCLWGLDRERGNFLL